MARHIAPDNDIDNCGLTYGQLQELWLGVGHNGSLFRDEEELRDAWDRGRSVVMRIWANNGRRPQAWWYFDAPGLGLKWPGYDRQQSYLFTAGVLAEAECDELLRFWRREFEFAQTPDFSLNDGKQILQGDRARAAHYAWADIPAELVERWSQEHRARRRGKRTEQAPSGSDGALKVEAQ